MNMGGWFRVLNQGNEKVNNEKSPAAKTDYHPFSACYETLRALGEGFDTDQSRQD